MISRDFIQQMLAAADLPQIVGERVTLQKRGNNLLGLCPFHAEKTPSFSVNIQKGYYHCFGCGVSGDALSFIVQTEAGGDFMNGVELLATRLGMQVPRGKDDGGTEIAQALIDARDIFCKQLATGKAAAQYVEERGILPDTAKKFYIGCTMPGWHNIAKQLSKYPQAVLADAGLLRKNDKGESYDYFRNRLMFPIMESKKRVNGFGARTLDENEPPKYLNSPETRVFSKKRTVFGVPQAIDSARERNRVIVTEGYMDVVKLSQAGFGEAVAVMGTALTIYQMRKIARIATNVVFAFDGDNAGQEAAWRGLPGVLPALSDGMSVSFMFLPPGDDPDSFVGKNGADALEQLIAHAVPLGDYIAKQLWEKSKAANDEGRASDALSAGKKYLSMLDSEKAPFLRELLAKKLAARAGIAPDVVRRAATRPVSSGGNNSRFKMRGEGAIFLFLSCLSTKPAMLDISEPPPPLPGNDPDAAVLAAVFHYLRTHRSEDGEPDIIGFLNNEGYSALTWQMLERCRQGFGASPEKEFQYAMFLDTLKERSRNPNLKNVLGDTAAVQRINAIRKKSTDG